MSIVFQALPWRVPFVEPTGRISQEWWPYISNIFQSVEGSSLSLNELASLLALNNTPVNYSTLESDIKQVKEYLFTLTPPNLDQISVILNNIQSYLFTLPSSDSSVQRLNELVSQVQSYLYTLNTNESRLQVLEDRLRALESIVFTSRSALSPSQNNQLDAYIFATNH